ncbi:MAG TPA: hypothetical protein VI997_03180, partial [Candidatus Thermoplasmatota archaeon]|nr:hypothetical protein [Candidatus Thermoplasmatota archaeon]
EQGYAALDRRVTSEVPREALPFAGNVRDAPADRGPVESREGTGLVNLTFFHVWDLANGDHVWLDVRSKDASGAWTAWEPLDGDLVYEYEVDYATAYQLSALCDWYNSNPNGGHQKESGQLGTSCRDDQRIEANGGLFLVDMRGGRISGDSTAGGDEYRGVVPITPSQLLESMVDEQNPPPAYYNSQVDAGAGKEDTRTWADKSASGFDPDALQIRKAHFTLNRFIGREVQIGFHFLANAAASGERGWYVDEVRVNAAVPDRDWSVVAVGAPEPGDVLAAGTRVRPTAFIANNGRFDVEDVNVTFRLVTLDGSQVALEETVPVPRIRGVERLLVGTRSLSEPLPAGGYRIEASIHAPERKGTTAQLDGNMSNNEMTWPFAVRSVVSLKVDIHVPAGVVMTDLDEAKEGMKVVVTNRGNTNVTGTLNVTVSRVAESTGDVVGEPEVIAFETILPAELPYGKDLTIYGSDANFATRLVTWAGAEPGIFRVQAVFTEVSGVVVEAPPQDVFVRQTPDAYLGPLEFAHSVRKLPFTDVRPFDVSQAGWRTWGYWGEANDGNACAAKGTDDSPPPLCPLPRTNGGLGTASGNWTWLATHDDNLQRGVGTDSHGTNLFDEGILEAPLVVGPSRLSSPSDRLYVTFRHHADFFWPTNDPALIAAEPTAFRGIFRVVEDDGVQDSPKTTVGNFSTPEGAPPASRDVTVSDRIFVERVYTDRAAWDKATVDITAALEGLTGTNTRIVRLQWIIQSTPANVVPDWRISQKQQTASAFDGNPKAGAATSSECSGVGSGPGLCSQFDPVKRWAVDEIHVFPSPAAADPIPNPATELLGDAQGGDAEPVTFPGTLRVDRAATRAKYASFTDCDTMLDPDSGRRNATVDQTQAQASRTQGDQLDRIPVTASAMKCRGWERVQEYLYPTLWYLEVDPALKAPTNPAHDETWWLRWGNVQGSSRNQHPSIIGAPSVSRNISLPVGFYSVAQSPAFRLLGAQDAALVFDHWHEFSTSPKTLQDPLASDPTVTYPYAMEGGNVWITGTDRDGAVVVHEILYPSEASDATYNARVYPTPGGGDNPAQDSAYLRGVPEFASNYSRGGGNAAFIDKQGQPAAAWQRVTFDLGRYTAPELRDLDYRLEFHAFAGNLGGTALAPSSGWRIDNIMVRELRLANDVALASIESPPTLVGPGVTQPIVLRVRNDGVFEQRGVGVEYQILRDGEVVYGPFVARLPYGSPEDALPGLRDVGEPDKNATFPFNVSWTPEEEGTYLLEARVNLSASSSPFEDENPMNDLVRKTIVVKERHDIFVHG